MGARGLVRQIGDGGHPDHYFPPFITPIWRHTDYMQFVSLLATSALHFARASTLPDLFEGALTLR